MGHSVLPEGAGCEEKGHTAPGHLLAIGANCWMINRCHHARHLWSTCHSHLSMKIHVCGKNIVFQPLMSAMGPVVGELARFLISLTLLSSPEGTQGSCPSCRPKDRKEMPPGVPGLLGAGPPSQGHTCL